MLRKKNHIVISVNAEKVLNNSTLIYDKNSQKSRITEKFPCDFD